jgi:chaperonin cofactor prefoldin
MKNVIRHRQWLVASLCGFFPFVSTSVQALENKEPLSSSATNVPTSSVIAELQQTNPSLELPQLTAQAAPKTTQHRSSSLQERITQQKQEDLGQVTSVSQLSDVQPTDWAYQALQSLVERYGCIAGYPNGTFRGNRAATRYEMAAALNACLDQISDRFATKEDLEAVKALQEEFKAELATLKGRVDSLEARTATLEAQQFSTTTKLSGV